MSTPATSWVRLNSVDGYSFIIPKEMALGSGTIKSSLDDTSNFTEKEEQTVNVQQRGIILTRIVEYLAYKHQYSQTAAKDITEDFADRIEPEVALELLMAADYLEL